MIYTVSYVVVGGSKEASAIMNRPDRPVVGETVTLGDAQFEVTEVKRMLPPSDEFEFLHVTLKPVTAD